RRPIEWWISVLRLFAVPFAVLQVALTKDYPSGYASIAWLLTAALAIGAVALYATVRDTYTYRLIAMLFDFSIVAGFTVLYGFELGTPTRQLLFLAIVVGAVRFGMRGGIAIAVAAVPVAAVFEQQRSHWFHVPYRIEYVTFQAGAGLLMALLVGWVVARLDEERATAEQRAEEAEGLRDELGRRADLLDAANRCARALSSSLDLDEAFSAFIRELRGLLPFDRVAIVLAEDGVGRIIATAGEEADGVMAAGAEFSTENSLISEIVARGQTVYRHDMSSPEYTEETRLLELGLHSRVAAPLLVGARTIGLISLSRRQPDAFEHHEVELAGLLGRLAASAVQNIRAYESERRTVDELRRLSALRADFVSLVSHELRSPMAAVIGAARTLQARWRELKPEQRESFLALIGDETTRLAALIGDVLDTSRIDAGTFSYRFSDVDIGALVQDTVAIAAVGQDEVPILAEVGPGVLPVRGDPERLRQIFGNLIDNAVKYSPAGEPVEVRVAQANGEVLISVRDRGPGIKSDDQRLIFEKFGRVAAGNSKPGSGLGLYIARSIVET
ncbi:MAG TPA: ATP-binding protein, partial [Kofleriaceae bacterium]|nr:ATP-binding protein [Kofleriaceae bacterium]